MTKFISCDWGTSSFRIRLVERDALTVLSASSSAEGIAQFHNRWKKSGLPESERVKYYSDFLDQQLNIIAEEYGSNLNELPVILSGMASSTIGMIELAYKELPIDVSGTDIPLKRLRDGQLIVVSGLRTQDDVLRGEETMLIGCDIENDLQHQVFIFPGTHSKHIDVKGGRATGFRTFMTGEMFDLLSNKSILANSVAKPEENEFDIDYFERGLKKAMAGDFLNDIFSVRTNKVLNNVNEADNYDYLSGIVLGHELKHLQHKSDEKITLVCNGQQKKRYMHALRFMLNEQDIAFRDADQALVRGHEIILQHHLLY